MLPEEVVEFLEKNELSINDLNYFTETDLKEFFTIKNRVIIRKYLEEQDAIGAGFQ